MTEPWFQPNGILNYRSLTWQGRVVRAATYLAMALSLAVGFFFTEPESMGWWATGALGFTAFLIGHAVVLWKMDWGYRRR
jgi:hypothetical protein